MDDKSLPVAQETLLEKFALVHGDTSWLIQQLDNQQCLPRVDREEILERLDDLEAALRGYARQSQERIRELERELETRRVHICALQWFGKAAEAGLARAGARALLDAANSGALCYADTDYCRARAQALLDSTKNVTKKAIEDLTMQLLYVQIDSAPAYLAMAPQLAEPPVLDQEVLIVPPGLTLKITAIVATSEPGLLKYEGTKV